jgi:hypothetical protein
VGQRPRQKNILKKRGRKVTKRKDLHPAQPVVRHREGLAKKIQQIRIQGLGREERGQQSNKAALHGKL